jgi:hydrogenase expression/formation protein HypC
MCLAVPGKLLSVTSEDALTRSGRVSFGGVIKDVNLACVPEAKVGDYVIVHVGFALSIVDEAEAEQVFAYLRQMSELAVTAPPVPSPAARAPAPAQERPARPITHFPDG